MTDARQVTEFNPRYTWIRARQLEGTFPGDQQTGIWPISWNRIAYSWGNVPLTFWPLSTEWPPDLPPGLDEAARPHRILFYQRVRDLKDCLTAIDAANPIMAAFEISDSWFDAPNGVIGKPKQGEETVGAHCVLLLGFDAVNRTLKFVNSWGDEWGDHGFGYLPVEYFDTHFLSAWIMEIIQRQDTKTDYIQHLSWGFRSVLAKAVHVREIYDSTSDTRMAWAIAVERDGWLDLEDVFVRPEFRGRKYGSQLCEMIRVLARDAQLPVRFWFSHADNPGIVQEKLCRSLGLRIGPSGVRWSPYLAIAPAQT